MLNRIYINNVENDNLEMASNRTRIENTVALKAAALLVINMWFPEEDIDLGENWEEFLKKTEQQYRKKNSIIKNDVSVSFRGETEVVFEYSDELQRISKDMELSYRQIYKYLIEEKVQGKIKNFIPEYQQKIQVEVNNTAADISTKSLHGQVLENAHNYPDKIALEMRDIDGNWLKVTYLELKIRAFKVAKILQVKGVKKGDKVAVVLPKGVNQVYAVLGTLIVGATYVPVGIYQPIERKKKIFLSGNIKYILTDETYQAELQKIENIVSININETEGYPELDMCDMKIEPDLLAYIIYTSGTTGEPKGVMVTHRAAYNTIYDIIKKYHVTERDCLIGISELDFDLSVFDIFGILSVGGTLIVLNEKNKKEPFIWKKIFRERNITIWNSAPGPYEMFLVALGTEKIGNLRCILLSGDWVKKKLLTMTFQLWKDCIAIVLGGATEVGIWSVYFRVTQIVSEWKSIPYGKPLANQFLRVVNSKGRDCPFGIPGELWIGGSSVAEGYLNDEKLTTEKFVIIDGVKWYRTGDKVQYMEDGNIEFLGRLDEQVKLNGYRIELGEIESVIREKEGINDAIAVVINNSNSSELIAAAVPEFKKYSITPHLYLHKEEPDEEVMDREASVVRFILELCGNNTKSLKLGEELLFPEDNGVIVYWREWLQQENWITQNEKGYVFTGKPYENLRLELYPQLEKYIPMFKAIIKGNKSINALLENELFSPEELLLKGKGTNRFFEEIFSIIDNCTKIKIAILNARTGALAEKLLDMKENNAKMELTLIDESMGMLEKGKARLKGKNVSFYHYESGYVDPKYLKHFDCVVVAGGLHQYKRVEKAFELVSQLLVPGGTLLALEYEKLDPMAIISSTLFEHGFLDYNRKRKNTSLLTCDEWIELFKESVFSHITIDAYTSTSMQIIKASISNQEAQIDVEELREHLKQNLVPYMVPKEIIYFLYFPLTENGKVDRKRIRQLLESKKQNSNKNTKYQGMEVDIAEIWKKIFSIGCIGREESFFEIGGDSLLATQFVDQIKQNYDVEISLREIFDNPELNNISKIIENRIKENSLMIEGEI